MDQIIDYSCLRNVVALFHIIQKEQEWRRKNNRPDGFDVLKNCRPIVAVGAEEPLADQLMMADFFHGRDGLGGIHDTHPHLSPSDTWRTLFNLSSSSESTSTATETSFSKPPAATSSELEVTSREHSSFVPSNLPAHKQILKLLCENDAGSITIVAVGPMTNLALAAAEDVETFLKVKEVVVMGGAVNVPGNITPLAEFNVHSDPYAFARILALTSPTPASTMPPVPPDTSSSPSRDAPPPFLQPYPEPLSCHLPLSLLPLDITNRHLLLGTTLSSTIDDLKAAGSPLAQWVSAFLAPTLQRSRESGFDGLSLHDPLAVWYAITSASSAWQVDHDVDLRVEAAGQWTRGACITDRRGSKKKKVYVREMEEGKKGPAVPNARPGDAGGWKDEALGNRIRVVLDSEEGMREGFEKVLLERLFGAA